MRSIQFQMCFTFRGLASQPVVRDRMAKTMALAIAFGLVSGLASFGAKQAQAATTTGTTETQPKPTLFNSQAECLKYRDALNSSPVQNSSPVFNPCKNQSPVVFVWGNSILTFQECADTGGGLWQLFVTSKATATRKVFSTSGYNKNGTFFCSSIPYMSQEVSVTTTWDANQRAFSTCTSTTTYTPEVVPQSLDWIKFYGTPTRWRNTTYSLTTNCKGQQSVEPVLQEGQKSVEQWQSATP